MTEMTEMAEMAEMTKMAEMAEPTSQMKRQRTQNSWPTSLERQFLDETPLADPAPPAAPRGRREQKPSPPERQLLDKQPGGGRGLRHLLLSRWFLDHWKLVASWQGGGRRQKLLQAHLGTYFSQPEQHRAGNDSSGLLGTC